MATDAETGEWNQEVETLLYDQETGEIFDYRLLANPPPPPPQRQRDSVQRSYEDDDDVPRRKTGRRGQREVTLGYNPTHKLFLVPSLFLFFRITALVLIFCEIWLHLWAHRKNHTNSNPAVFYRSPLHLITSQFCARCTSEMEMIKLGRIQDKRRAKQLLAFTT